MKLTARSPWFISLCALASACAVHAGVEDENAAYLHNREYRRAELEQSLESKSNGYARLRLAHYASGLLDDWDALPEWNPRVSPVREADLGAHGPLVLGDDGRALANTDEARRGSVRALLALGEAAFARFPVQLLPDAAYALLSPELATRYGFWRDANAGVGGIVRTEMADGSVALAMTCSTCHARRASEDLELGAPNIDLDLGRLAVEAGGSGGGEAMLRWGPGRLDVSSASGLEPVKIPDLRSVRFVRSLQTDATVTQRSVVSLAIRIETLIVTAHSEVLRPPREISLALAVYLWNMSSRLALRPPASLEEHRGEQVFSAVCAGCHVPPDYSGAHVAVDVIGTDPVAGRSAERGTGFYRVPSLRGVSTRGPLLHDGSLLDLESMFDPTRLADDYTSGRRGPGPVRGHLLGLDLPPGDRAVLLSFLRTL